MSGSFYSSSNITEIWPILSGKYACGIENVSGEHQLVVLDANNQLTRVGLNPPTHNASTTTSKQSSTSHENKNDLNNNIIIKNTHPKFIITLARIRHVSSSSHTTDAYIAIQLNCSPTDEHPSADSHNKAAHKVSNKKSDSVTSPRSPRASPRSDLLIYKLTTQPFSIELVHTVALPFTDLVISVYDIPSTFSLLIYLASENSLYIVPIQPPSCETIELQCSSELNVHPSISLDALSISSGDISASTSVLYTNTASSLFSLIICLLVESDRYSITIGVPADKSVPPVKLAAVRFMSPLSSSLFNHEDDLIYWGLSNGNLFQVHSRSGQAYIVSRQKDSISVISSIKPPKEDNDNNCRLILSGSSDGTLCLLCTDKDNRATPCDFYSFDKSAAIAIVSLNTQSTAAVLLNDSSIVFMKISYESHQYKILVINHVQIKHQDLTTMHSLPNYRRIFSIGPSLITGDNKIAFMNIYEHGIDQEDNEPTALDIPQGHSVESPVKSRPFSPDRAVKILSLLSESFKPSRPPATRSQPHRLD